MFQNGSGDAAETCRRVFEGGVGVGVGYEAATKCYVERLQRFEQAAKLN